MVFFTVFLHTQFQRRSSELALRKTWSKLEISKQTEQLFSTLSEQLVFPTIISDKNLRIVRCNKACEELIKNRFSDDDQGIFPDSKTLSLNDLFNQESMQELKSLLEKPHDDEISLQIRVSLSNEKANKARNDTESLYRLDIKEKRILNQILYFATILDLKELQSMQSQTDKLLEFHMKPLQDIIEMVERDYIKWNNLQILEVIKESDLKNLAQCVTGLTTLKNIIYVEGVNMNKIKDKEFPFFKEEPADFYVRNVIIHCCEILSTHLVELGVEINLKFEDSFPQQAVFGRVDLFRQVNILKYI